jgi:transposase
METLILNVKERRRLVVLSKVKEGQLSVAKAAEALGISVRQTRRTWKRFRLKGDAGLVHQLRGRRSNHAQTNKARALALCREKYADFGAALASECLCERDGLPVNRVTLWRWLRQAGQLLPRRRSARHRQRRERRRCCGELLQMDGSTHDWFEGRGPACVLFVTIDDATSRLFARFYQSEDTASAFDLFGRYVKRYGLPQALYVDKDSIYRVNDPLAREAGRQRGALPLTQFGRAMKQLGVEVICANSPQAKGRVERANGTLQDRLVKALRLAGISTLAAANAFLEKRFLRDFNARFAKPAADGVNLHRPVGPGLKLAEVLCVREKRTVGRDWCVSYDRRVLQITRRHEGLKLVGKTVEVLARTDGSLAMMYQGTHLNWRESKAQPTPAARPTITLGERTPWRPGPEHPWKKSAVKPAPLRADSLRSSPLRYAGLTATGG